MRFKLIKITRAEYDGHGKQFLYEFGLEISPENKSLAAGGIQIMSPYELKYEVGDFYDVTFEKSAPVALPIEGGG